MSTFRVRAMRNMLAGTAVGLSVLATAPRASAVPMTELDSSEFTYKYEMDVDPTTQNLDGSAHTDWRAHIGNVTISDGLAHLTGAGTFMDGRLSGGMSSIWQSAGFNTAAEWTIEVRAHVTNPDDPGPRGYWGVSTSNFNGTISELVEIRDATTLSIVLSTNGASHIDYALPRNVKEGFANLRIAKDAEGIWVWLDNILINSEAVQSMSDPVFINNRILVGGYSNSLNTGVDIDYIRITMGAFAPVGQVIPEPASLCARWCGGAAVAAPSSSLSCLPRSSLPDGRADRFVVRS